MYYSDVPDLSVLLHVKSAWKNATVETSMRCFPSEALFEFAFTHLLLCKKIILDVSAESFSWSRSWRRLPAIMACNTLVISGLNGNRIQPADVVKWLEHEASPEKKWSEPREMILNGYFRRGTDGLLTVMKMAFSASGRPKPYVAHILPYTHQGNLDEGS
ncbi:hypothetical protein AAVH_08487 [Aphelenchoides avenae]|nr:hypothetical protein AAVH_08487 [Aphelenchus avenae]